MIAAILIIETLLTPLVALGLVLAFLFSPKRGRLEGLAAELPERFGFVPPDVRARLKGKVVWWFHAASAGEVSGLSPLIEAIALRDNPPAVVLTTTTRSGREAAGNVAGVAWAQLAPLDAWPCVSRFLSAVRPTRLILSETELWPSALILADRAGLGPCLVNARLTQKSFSRYIQISKLMAPVLRTLSLVAAQSEEDARRFRTLGVPAARIRVTGNAKYDRTATPAADEAAQARLTAMAWDGSPLFVAGSTHPLEEEMILAAYLSARRAVPLLRLVLAPRHLERVASAVELLERGGLRLSRWSAAEAAELGADALVLDVMGVLPSFYPLSCAAFVGGTLVPVGGHNLLEPALAGVPVLFGPHTEHIHRPAKLLVAEGGGRLVNDAHELSKCMADFAGDETLSRVIGGQARALAVRLQGATTRILAELEAPPR
jgi:3-deoxy-D-manno-octulosonic-acid transferase